MVLTPWGDLGGDGENREGGQGQRDKRESLFAAMVASCDARGFEATSVAHLLELAEVSRASFYARFENKADCFSAMLAALVDAGMGTVERRSAEAEGGRARAEAATSALAELIATQPAAARACMIDAFAAGATAREAMDLALSRFEALLATAYLEEGAATMPRDLVRGLAGAIPRVFQKRLYQGGAAELPQLAPALCDWLLGFEPPPRPLRRKRRAPLASPFSPAFARHDSAERILRAAAACIGTHGYAATTVAQIARMARISQRTFYEHFEGKEAATVAALDSSGAQILAATGPAIRRESDWRLAVHSALSTMCGFMAAEPDFARLRTAEVYAAGPAALEARDLAGAELLGALLSAAPAEIKAKAEPLLLELSAAAIYALLYDCMAKKGPEELPRVAPYVTYLTLMPLIGAKEACEVANEETRRSPRERAEEPDSDLRAG
jgi:AcrR family transcriptional regulator